jgi:hypothetical protein
LEKHEARKMTPGRRRKDSSSSSLSSSSSSSDSDSKSESTLRLEVRFSVNIGSNTTPRMDCLINRMNSRHKHVYRPLPDSGATRSIIRTDVMEELKLKYDKHGDTKVKLFNASGEPMKVEGCITFKITSKGMQNRCHYLSRLIRHARQSTDRMEEACEDEDTTSAPSTRRYSWERQ